MKYLLVLLVVVIAIGIWRSKRRVAAAASATARPKAAPALKNPQAMVACAHCGLHLPLADAVTNASGQSFCSEEHRLLGSKNASSD